MRMNKLLYAVRVVTIPPVFAAALLLTMSAARPGLLSAGQLLCGLLFFGVLPAAGYPLQRCIPYFKEKEREGQRTLAMLMSAAGYLLGLCSACLTRAPKELHIIYLEYALCGLAVLAFNRGFHLRASGHACGIAAPVLLLAALRLWWPAAVGAALVIPVGVASVMSGRHTVGQILGGYAIAAACMAALACAFSL